LKKVKSAGMQLIEKILMVYMGNLSKIRGKMSNIKELQKQHTSFFFKLAILMLQKSTKYIYVCYEILQKFDYSVKVWHNKSVLYAATDKRRR
jgi:hypothetical protein